MADAALQGLAAVMQPLPHQGRGLLGVGRQVRGEFDLDARGLVQLDDPHAGRGLHRMTAVGDDEHVGGPGGGAEQHSQESGRKQAPLRYKWVGYGSWHVEPP